MNLQFLQKILLWHLLTGNSDQKKYTLLQRFEKGLYGLKFFLRKLLISLVYSNGLKKISKKGAISLISSFIFFAFSIFGLGLLYFSQIHFKISAFKKNSIFLEYASENGIKHGFSNLLDLLSHASSPSILSSEHLNQLKENVQSYGTGIIEEILGLKAPLTTSETWENQSWNSTTNFFLERIIEQENYFLALYKVSIHSEGVIQDFNQKRKSTLLASLGIFAGHIPLSFFPFLIDKTQNFKGEKNLAKKNEISIFHSKKNHLQPKIYFTEKELLPEEVHTELGKAFKMAFFHPQNLPSTQLRTFLGLEEKDEPVPDGVYLIKDNLGLGGIYVQGDVEEMIVAVENDFQVLFFCTRNGTWIIKYSPSESKTYFASPEETSTYDLIPIGIIIINGKVNSFGGGIVNSSGEITMVKDEEVPSILKGIQLTIISSDKLTISSHLILQGVKQQEGVPYVKDSNTQLNLFSTGKDFWDKTTKEGGITIEESAPMEIKIQATLTASGNGFAIEGEGKKVHILGSIQASNFISHENSLKITFDDLWLEDIIFPQNVPTSKEPVLFVSFFKALEWEEF